MTKAELVRYYQELDEKTMARVRQVKKLMAENERFSRLRIFAWQKLTYAEERKQSERRKRYEQEMAQLERTLARCGGALEALRSLDDAE